MIRRRLTAVALVLALLAALAAATPSANNASASNTTTAGRPATYKQAYGKLCARLKEVDELDGIQALLSWDERVMMPANSWEHRGKQMAALAGVLHDKSTAPELGALYSQLRAAPSGTLDQVGLANIREGYKAYQRATAMPKQLSQRSAELYSDASEAWKAALKASDFSKFAPFLKQRVQVWRQEAAAIDPRRDPYTVHLEAHAKGFTADRLDRVLSQVRDGIVPLLAAVKKGRAPDRAWLAGSYDRSKQTELFQQVAVDLGFDLGTGRLDASLRPFSSSGHATDARITTAYNDNDLLSGLGGTIHETGHAMYNQGRNLKWDGLPVYQAMDTTIHESQALLQEWMLGLSKPFQHYLLPKLKAAFPARFANRTVEELYASQNAVSHANMIRRDADELTYPLHIVLRYEIERGLVNGTIAVEDVPKLWADKMEQYLGVRPKNDAEGCLQDIHWSVGHMGYFPTYTLGAMYATQMWQQAQKDIPSLDQHIRAGNFKPLKAWLSQKIHSKGSLYPSGDALLVQLTGSPLKPQVYLDYLRNKYSELYQIKL